MGDIPAGFVRPFKYDGYNFIYDGNANMAADFNGEGSHWIDGKTKVGVLRPRGWATSSTSHKREATENEAGQKPTSSWTSGRSGS